jgi:glucose-6-phosphate isomerase
VRSQPYGYPILQLYEERSPFNNHLERRLSSLQNKFLDQEAFQLMVEEGDPVIYDVYEDRRPEAVGELASGLSIVHPGRVGREYFMTKGHYHKVRDTAEIYYCIQGRGALLMENEAGDTAVEEFCPGRVVYVTPSWAHRSINTGEKDLITFFVYPGHAGHDYGAIDAKGFRKRLVEENGLPTIIDSQL